MHPPEDDSPTNRKDEYTPLPRVAEREVQSFGFPTHKTPKACPGALLAGPLLLVHCWLVHYEDVLVEGLVAPESEPDVFGLLGISFYPSYHLVP